VDGLDPETDFDAYLRKDVPGLIESAFGVCLSPFLLENDIDFLQIRDAAVMRERTERGGT
jgi:hypothetical protein